MQIQIDGVTNLEKVSAELRRINGKFISTVTDNIRKAVAALHRQVDENIKGPIIKRRTGNLARSLRSDVDTTSSQVTGTVGVLKTPYAAILELGGTITGKPWLTIPLSGVNRPSSAHPGGETGLTAREVIDQGGFFLKSKAGNLLIVQRNKKGNITPIFVLKRQVEIPAFGYLSKSFAQIKSKLDGILMEGLLDAAQ